MNLSTSHPFLWRTGTAQIIRIRGADSDYAHRFGGLLDLNTIGFPENQRSLHRLITLDLTDPRLAMSIPNVRFFPLLYGFTFSGCELCYRVLSDKEVQIIELTPQKSSEEWPYPNYPGSFEPISFDFSEPEPLSFEQLNALTWQGITDVTDETFIAVVPPSDSYGASLWGDGDAEEIQIIFRINSSNGVVSVSNQCG